MKIIFCLLPLCLPLTHTHDLLKGSCQGSWPTAWAPEGVGVTSFLKISPSLPPLSRHVLPSVPSLSIFVAVFLLCYMHSFCFFPPCSFNLLHLFLLSLIGFKARALLHTLIRSSGCSKATGVYQCVSVFILCLSTPCDLSVKKIKINQKQGLSHMQVNIYPVCFFFQMFYIY